MNNNSLAKAIGIVGLLLLICYTAFNYHPIFWDEEYYLSNIQRFEKLGWSYEFFRDYKGPAGPSYTLVHLGVSRLFNFEVPFIRFVNIGFLLGIIFFTNSILKKAYGNEFTNLTAKTLGLVSIPMIFVVSGMVLTELPALFFLLVSIYFVMEANKKRDNRKPSDILLLICGGIFAGLSILGRQPYLVVLLPLALFFVDNEKVHYFKYLIFLVSCLVLVFPFFIIWGGILPGTGGDIATRGGIEPMHLLLAGGYAFASFIFIAPAILKGLKNNNKIIITAVLFCFLLLSANLYFRFISYAPLRTVAENVLPKQLYIVYAYGMPVLIAFLGVVLSFILMEKAWKKKEDIFYLFSVISLAMILGTSLFITHQFSSRYVVQALPFFIFIGIHDMKMNRIELLMRGLGICLGLISLHSFYTGTL